VKYTIFLICLSLSFPLVLTAETYKWVDENGVVTFSQSPPPSVEAEKIKLRKTTSEGSSSKARLNSLRQNLADSAEDRELQKKAKQEEKEQSALKKRNCEAAQSNLRKLKDLGNRLFHQGGEYKRLTEEERQSLMQKERGHIKKNCGS
jgi:hypothetical protein